MRKQGEWMAKWDNRLLEYILENKGGTPSEMAKNEYIGISSQYISQRLRELYEHDLLDRIGRGAYTISEEGRYYLRGAYDAKNEEFVEEELLNYQWLAIESERRLDELRNWMWKWQQESDDE